MQSMIIRDDAFECYPAVMANCAGYLGRGCELMFIGEWYFNYDASKNRFGDRITANSKLNFITALDAIYGIRVVHHKVRSYRSLIKVLDRQLSGGMPVTLLTDTYWCSWCQFYKKLHYEHALLVTAKREEQYECIDPYFSDDAEILDMKGMYTYIERYGIVKCSQKQLSVSKSELIRIIDRNISCSSNENIIEKIRHFACDFRMEFDIRKEVSENEDVHNAKIFAMLNKLIKNRESFIKVIDYLKESETDRFSDALLYMNQSISLWNSFSRILMKLYVSNHADLIEKGYQLLIKIADAEQQVYDIFKDSLRTV